MKEFAGRTAVVSGGGSGMGRELVRQLVAEACNVATCDVSPTGLAETQRLCEAAGLPQGLRVTTHIADVADRTQVERFRDEVADRHRTDKIHLLFNNAGISGGGSMVTNSRDEWERTFNICWGGVYNCTRAFLPMLQGRPASAAYTVVEPRDHLWRFLAHNNKARLLPLARARARALPFGTSKMMDLVDAWDRRCFPMA
jgi:NAD(P)-dependent dehydrogenase (short-subunit alcohol dehydrogenase family)